MIIKGRYKASKTGRNSKNDVFRVNLKDKCVELSMSDAMNKKDIITQNVLSNKEFIIHFHVNDCLTVTICKL